MYAQKRAIENTHIIRERDRERFRELFAVLFLGVPIGLFLLLFTWQNLEVIRLGREARQLQGRLEEYENQNKRLRIRLERLTALEAVEKKAQALGFSRTDPGRLVNAVPAGAGEARR